MVSLDLTWWRRAEPKTTKETVIHPEWAAWHAMPHWNRRGRQSPSAPYYVETGKVTHRVQYGAAHLLSPRSGHDTTRSMCGVVQCPTKQTQAVGFKAERRYRGEVCQHCRRIWEELNQ